MTGVAPDYIPHELLGPLDSRYEDIDTIPWGPARYGTQSKVLYKDNEAKQALIMVKADPGAVLSDHEHMGLELTYVIEGSLEDDYGKCTAGNFVWRPKGSRHQARCPNGAVFLVLFNGGARSVDTGEIFPNFEE